MATKLLNRFWWYLAYITIVDGLVNAWLATFCFLVDLFGRPFVKWFLYAIRLLSVLFMTLVYCGQTVGWIMAPLSKRGTAPNFQPISAVAKRLDVLKIPLGTEVDLGPGDIVLDGDPAPPQKKGAHHPQFWPIYCRQMAAWIKMPLGGEIGLGPGHIVLHGAQLPPSSPPRKGLSSRLFWHKSIVAKWSLISATAEVLFLITVFLGLHSVCTDEQFWRYTRCVSVQRGAFWDCVVSDHHLGGHIPQNAFWENRHFQAYLVKY